ncbi:MAG: hypothetical protein DRG66_08420 [Deltaproteobacteria bacterium]|nr:MAG: hypothetical protein DRG66_08420 [Deltaproteobacteria bacterium]
MIDRDVILTKAYKVEHHLCRIKEKREISLDKFLDDLDCQESILFNLQMAFQNCIDLAAHIISDEELGIVGSTNEMFYILKENGYIDRGLSENMVAAVGFRNLIVHEYGQIDLKQVYHIAHHNIDDLEHFVKAIVKKSGIS